MKQLNRFLILIASGVILLQCSSPKTGEVKEDIKAPSPEKVPHELTAHGNKRSDNYYWMKLSDAQKNARERDDQTKKVISYLDAENDYLKAKMKHTEAFQEKLYKEIIGRIKQTDESVPYKDNGYWYYNRYEE